MDQSSDKREKRWYSLRMRELHIIAHDIRSRENVGTLLRTADSLGVSKLWFTGYTPIPPDEKIQKVALGAEQSVVWEQVVDVLLVLEHLKKQRIPVFALEVTPEAIDVRGFKPPERLALLLGTETTGVPASLLEACNGVVKITQRGIKESLNVAVAAAIASWAILDDGK